MGKAKTEAGTLRETNEWAKRTHGAGSGQEDTYCLPRKLFVYRQDEA